MWLPSIAAATPAPTPARWSAPAGEQAAPGLGWEVSAPALAPGERGVVTLRVALPEGYALDRGSLEVVAVDPASLTWEAWTGPAGRVLAPREGDDAPKVVLSGDLPLEIPVAVPATTAPGAVPVRFLVGYQGCYQGLCHPFTTDVVDSTLQVQPSSGEAPPPPRGNW